MVVRYNDWVCTYQRTLEIDLGVVVLAHLGPGLGQLVQALGHLGVILPVGLLQISQRPQVQLLRLLVLALVVAQHARVEQTASCGDAVKTENPLKSVVRRLISWRGGRHTDVGVRGAVSLHADGERPLVQGLGLFVLADL